MFARLAPTFFALWLLAGLEGLGVHAHRHHAEPSHAHAATIFDADHHAAHAAGAVDEETAKHSLRSGPQLPALPIGTDAVGLEGVTRAYRAAVPLPDDPRVTGPPPLRRPPGQAPPFQSKTA